MTWRSMNVARHIDIIVSYKSDAINDIVNSQIKLMITQTYPAKDLNTIYKTQCVVLYYRIKSSH